MVIRDPVHSACAPRNARSPPPAAPNSPQRQTVGHLRPSIVSALMAQVRERRPARGTYSLVPGRVPDPRVCGTPPDAAIVQTTREAVRRPIGGGNPPTRGCQQPLRTCTLPQDGGVCLYIHRRRGRRDETAPRAGWQSPSHRITAKSRAAAETGTAARGVATLAHTACVAGSMSSARAPNTSTLSPR